MRITTEPVRNVDRKTIGFAVNLRCRNENEFVEAYQKIKEVNGVEWCGCPDEDNTRYMDTVAYVDKGCYSVAELKVESQLIAKECKALLNL